SAFPLSLAAHLLPLPVLLVFSRPRAPRALHSFPHDALPISSARRRSSTPPTPWPITPRRREHWLPWPITSSSTSAHRTLRVCGRSEEHTSELQSRFDLVCRLLLEKKNIIQDAGSIDATVSRD